MKRSHKNGFTLVELLIALSILIILVMILLGSIDPISVSNKGFDARRKKDLNRIKVGFEEYYSDKQCYPTSEQWLSEMKDKKNCGGSFFASWLPNWPCDPKGIPYSFAFEKSSCPKWFVVTTLLDNQDDPDVPDIVKSLSAGSKYSQVYISGKPVNYGVSSTNILWYDLINVAMPGCENNCYRIRSNGGCENARDGGEVDSHCSGTNCYRNPSCSEGCRVSVCNSAGS